MGFPISSIGTDSGLNWETNLNAALTVIDGHNHSPGSGQQIQPNGININADLTFNSNNAIALRAARFTPQASPIANAGADVGEIYVSGNELYYNDVSGGNQVKLTSNGSVNATSSGIASGTATAAFSAGTLVVKSSSSSYGNVALQSVVLANSGNLTNQLTLQAPTLSSSYALTLPTIPGALSFMTLDASGNMAGSIAVSGALTTSNLSASANIVGTQLSASADILGSQLDSAAGIEPGQLNFNSGSNTVSSYSNGGATPTAVVTATLSGYTTNRPIFISFQDDGSASFGCGTFSISGGSTATFTIFAKTGPITVVQVGEYIISNNTSGTFVYPISVLNCIDLSATSSEYVLQAHTGGAGQTVTVTHSQIILVQM
jgi:hypothetical protein